MSKYRFDDLAAHLQDEYGEDLRWVANYDSDSYEYEFHHIRDDLDRDLKTHQLDRVIHRSLAVYNKRHAEEVYFHLGDADSLVVDYEKGTAFHLFLDDTRGVTVMLEPDVDVSLTQFDHEWRAKVSVK